MAEPQLKDAIAQAYRIARRRAKNPIRDARRQANLTRMRRRVIDFVPQYIDTVNGRGERVASRYVGHKAVFAHAG